MKAFAETYIRRAEIAQLIILHQLYMHKDSRNLVFQGGTAIRWCYGGNRFSEDIDFVTPLAPKEVNKILVTALKGVQKVMMAHFGAGSLNLRDKSSRSGSVKCFVDFLPDNSRDKISIKLEFEKLALGKMPQTENRVLSSLPSVAYLISSGDFLVPRPHAVVVVQTPAEILSDKARSLLERQYLKGRDFFDVWHLQSVLKTQVEPNDVLNKLTMYQAQFSAKRGLNFFAALTKENKKAIREAIEADLSRFLPPEIISVYRAEEYTAFVNAAQSLFSSLKKKGLRLP